MSARKLPANNSRLCTSRAHKNARYIQRIAAHLITDNKQGIASIIPPETLARLHTITNPREVIKNKELAILLEKNRLPSMRATFSDPLFNGTLYFVQINFNTPNGVISISDTDMQAAINYSKLAVEPISHYASQYSAGAFAFPGVTVSNNPIQYSVNLNGNTYTDNDLWGWVNDIANIHNLPTSNIPPFACLVILNPWIPQGILNTDEDPRPPNYVDGYHDKANTPFCFCNVFGQNLTVDDRQNVYAQTLSHEITEMMVDPLADLVNPEVCDACAGNCGNLWLDYFDNNNQFIDGSQSVPPPFNYTFFINSVIKPSSYDPESECAVPGSNPHDVCVYFPGQLSVNATCVQVGQLRIDVSGINFTPNSTIQIYSAIPELNPQPPRQLVATSLTDSQGKFQVSFVAQDLGPNADTQLIAEDNGKISISGYGGLGCT